MHSTVDRAKMFRRGDRVWQKENELGGVRYAGTFIEIDPNLSTHAVVSISFMVKH
jgi:hypothetical protein